ncbi:MAG: phosphoribosylpyrophosphate synthetase [Saprospiraceae bacterium]|jgi:hypothetical protein
MQAFSTLIEALDALKTEGYTEDFNLQADHIHCRDGAIKLHPEDFQIDKFFRFEGMTNPSDSSILCAVSSEKYAIKGVVVNGYGASASPLTDEMLEKLT